MRAQLFSVGFATLSGCIFKNLCPLNETKIVEIMHAACQGLPNRRVWLPINWPKVNLCRTFGAHILLHTRYERQSKLSSPNEKIRFNKLTSVFVCPVIDHEFCHNIVKEIVDLRTTLTMV